MFHSTTIQWPDLNQGGTGMKLNQFASGIGTGALFAVLAWSLLPQDADAYLDPGTGSYIFQVIVAALLGGLFMLKVFWARITGFFRKRLQRLEEAGSRPSQGTKTSLSATENVEPPAVSPGQPPLSEQDDN